MTRYKVFYNVFIYEFLFIVLQLGALKPSIGAEAQKGTSILTLIKDPYILCAAGERPTMCTKRHCYTML